MILTIFSGAKTFPAKSFPPDGTTFSQIALGQKLSKTIPAYSYWNMQFYQSEAAYIKFDFSIPRGASIGVYARRNALPTHTQYDILEVLSGFKARSKRGSHVSFFVFQLVCKESLLGFGIRVYGSCFSFGRSEIWEFTFFIDFKTNGKFCGLFPNREVWKSQYWNRKL